MQFRSLSLAAIVVSISFIICTFFYYHLWNKNRIVVDAPSYYTYMPAVFVYHDLHLNFIDNNPNFFKNKIWFYSIENNQRLIKHPIGFSFLLSPFFLVGHYLAFLINSPQDGYSMPYQNMVSIGILLYLFIGLYYLRKLLLYYFNEKIVALVILCTVMCTNLLWYSSFEGLMPHAVSFSLLCVCIYSFIKWLTSENRKYLIVFSVVFGLSLLIRPLSITTIIYFFIFGIFYKKGLRNFLSFIRENNKSVITGIIICIAITAIQLCYWKYATGKWLYDVYIDEHFIFNSPQIIPFLFSFRKGLFVYTPILVFSVIGLTRLYKSEKGFFYSTLALMCLSIYLLASWWAWSYGISWGLRPMIDYYSFLSIPMAAGFTLAFSKNKVISVFFSLFITTFILLNLFQTWQYKNGLIHYDDMSKEAYFKGFFQTKISNEWLDLLKPYDWQKRINGLPQIDYSKQNFFSLTKFDSVSFRGSNLLYLSMNQKANNLIAAYKQGTSINELFFIKFHEGNKISIQSYNGYYLSFNENVENTVTADFNSINPKALFTVEFLNNRSNQFALKAFNGKYLSIDRNFPFLLKANAESITKSEIFRYFLK